MSTADLPPPQARPNGRRSRVVPAALAAWFAVNLLILTGDFRGAVLVGGARVGGAMAPLLAMPSSAVLTAAAWAAFRLARLRTVTRDALLRNLWVHAAAAAGFAALDVVVRRAERLLLADPGKGFAPSRDAGEVAGVLVVYALLTLAAHAVEYARRYRERRLAELRLQASLARAELDRASAELRVLKLQLNPHFLFNSLHAVSALVHDAPDAAEAMVRRLGELLRQASTRVGTQEVSLDEEVRTLAPFLEVERIRLGGRLRADWAIEPEARGAYVPHMVLQPLAENAIKHGLAARPEGGRIEVSARRRGAWLELAVRDDGVGLRAASGRAAPGSGIGTANTRARLAQLYGADHALEMAPAEGGGTRVAVRIPFHEAPWPSRALEGPAAPGGEDPALPCDWRAGWRRALVGAVFLLQWARGYAGMRGMWLRPGRTVGAVEAAVCAGLNAALVTLLLAAAFVLARRAPVMGAGWGRALRRHLGAALLLGAVVTLERNLCALAWGTPVSTLLSRAAAEGAASQVLTWMLVFAIVSLVAHAVEYARRSRLKEAAGLRLQASLARAELERTSAELRGLKMQVNRRFLFTALEAVATRVHAAPGDAERMVVRLADLLRRAMESAGTAEATLEEEVRALEPFLEVERLRLGCRLRVTMEVDEDAFDALLPPLVLQPLVEDAIRRAAPGDGERRVTVSARRGGGWLEVEVRDDAPCGASAEAADDDDEGAGDARARLSALYGDRWALDAAPAADGGTRVLVRLPWHEEPWPGAAAPRAPLPEPTLAP